MFIFIRPLWLLAGTWKPPMMPPRTSCRQINPPCCWLLYPKTIEKLNQPPKTSAFCSSTRWAEIRKSVGSLKPFALVWSSEKQALYKSIHFWAAETNKDKDKRWVGWLIHRRYQQLSFVQELGIITKPRLIVCYEMEILSLNNQDVMG